MNNDYLLYEKMDMMDQNFPVIFHYDHLAKECGYYSSVSNHWHEKIELLYFTQGEVLVKCNLLEIPARKGDLVVINSNELHQITCMSDSTDYYCIIFDTSLLQSRNIDTCETKYINPIATNRILFKNKAENNKQISDLIYGFIREYEQKEIGYEMSLKAILYQLLVILLREYVQIILTPKEYDARIRNLNKLNGVLEYIEKNYTEKITIDQLCSMVNISRFHFCRLFKNITGNTFVEYLNRLRISKAASLLKNRDVNITEAAIECGFNDTNYFSRMFKKYKHAAPSTILKE